MMFFCLYKLMSPSSNAGIDKLIFKYQSIKFKYVTIFYSKMVVFPLFSMSITLICCCLPAARVKFYSAAALVNELVDSKKTVGQYYTFTGYRRIISR